MAMTETANRKDLELDNLLHRAGAFRPPTDVHLARPVREGRVSPRPGAPLHFGLRVRAITKYVVAVALVAVLAVPEAAGQSLLQKSDWQPKSFLSYLPTPSVSVPWLDHQDKLPKRECPSRWQTKS
jgi:hypothetical protein